MNPKELFCPAVECPLRGQLGQGNIVCHSRKERRYRCLACGRTFAETKGTPFYRLHTEEKVVVIILTLLAHGCPLQAVVAAFGFDERTVATWLKRAGEQCQRFHEQTVCTGAVDLQHVQADELWVKLVGRKVWLAMAMAMPSHLWLGGQIGGERTQELIEGVVRYVRWCAGQLSVLVSVDGLAAYVQAFCRAFRVSLPRPAGSGRGRPRQVLAEGFLLGQVIKQRRQEAGRKRVVGVTRRAVCGTLSAIEARVRATKAGTVLNTAFIERLNATFRGRLAALVRRSRCLVRQDATLRAGMWLVGCVYNFCDPHASLRQVAPQDDRRQWQPRTPAMAAGLTDHCWSVAELLHQRIRPLPWRAPRRRGRPPKQPRGIPWKLRPNRFILDSSTV